MLSFTKVEDEEQTLARGGESWMTSRARFAWHCCSARVIKRVFVDLQTGITTSHAHR